MHTRFMERSSSMAREKRALDSIDAIEGQPEIKRPALASVIVEALKVDSLHRLCSSLEPIFRKIVSEEVERALAKIGPSQLCGRSSPKQPEGANGRNLRLQFKTRLSLPLFTGGKVDGEQGASIHIVLVDATNGQVVTSGPESSAKLDVVVLEGDFNNEDDDDWSEEEFECRVVKEREGKRPLLTGDLQVCLKEGVGTLGDLTFTDNSSWIRSRRFRLGLKISTGYCEGIRIREAKTEDFIVKDHRGELYKKHYPPALNDEVWRLEKIGKDGAFHKRLNKAGIFTVEDFLRLVVRDSQGLRNILGSGMSNKMWEALVEHANSCVLSGKLYVYYSDDSRNVGVVFNNIYELSGFIANGHFSSPDSLSHSEKVYVDNLVNKAYEDWMNVVEYDSKSLLCSHDKSNSFNHQLVLQQEPSMPSGLTVGEDDNGSLHEPQSVNDFSNIVTTTTLPLQTHLYDAHSQLGFGGIIGTSNNLSAYKGGVAEEYLPENEIRKRSHEMLENDDMQHLLRWFNVNASHEDGDGGIPYPSNYVTPTCAAQSPLNYATAFIESRTHSSGRAVVGWLKLKAALRWGIFVRKKAAERRAQLVELD